MATKQIIVLFVSAFLLLFSCVTHSKGQGPAPVSVDPAITSLAGKLAEGLHKLQAKRVVIFDLSGPEREAHPIGKWLANQLSVELQTIRPHLQVIDRSSLTTTGVAANAGSDSAAYQKSREIAKKAGADSLVRGSFAALSNRVGVTLSVVSLDRRESPQVTGAIPISDEIRALSPEAIPTFMGSVPRAGTGGITNTTCKHCPLPEYTEEARAAKYQGTVTLDVVVTDQGTVRNVGVIRGPGLGLEEKSIATVKKWKFNPAVDLDGKPVAAKVEIEVTFRMF